MLYFLLPEDESLALALAAFAGGDATTLCRSLAGDRAAGVRQRVAELAQGSPATRRARLATALRERFSPAGAVVSPAELADRLAGEPPPLVGLALLELPSPRAADVASRLAASAAAPAAPDLAVRVWLRKRLLGDRT
jgi:hypothetical protein